MHRIAVFLLFCSISARAEFQFNENCVNAYKGILNLRLKEAREIIEKEKLSNPGNLIPYYLENNIDFVTLFIGENEKQFRQLKELKEKRIEILSKGNKNSPFYLFTQAEVHIQWAFVRLKFNEYVAAAYEFYAAYGLLEENIRKFPGFVPNQKSMGLLHALIGAIPEQYIWLVNMLGLKGTTQQGLTELKKLVNNNSGNDQYAFLYKSEAQYYIAFILIYLKTTETKEWEIIDLNDTASVKSNSFLCFTLACKANKVYKNEEMIRLLEMRPNGEEYYPFYFLDYLLGLGKLRRSDADANIYFERFINNFQGTNYIKAAYQKLAWYYYLRGDTPKYKHYISLCKTKGFANIDDDIQALIEEERGKLPNVYLLKSRLLFDGGYFSHALDVLKAITPQAKLDTEEQIELDYRQGRIYHEWGKINDAVNYYVKTLENGVNLPYYYAASAALHLGYIYEQKHDYQKARSYFNQCLAIKHHEYKQSIEYKATTALKRMEGK